MNGIIKFILIYILCFRLYFLKQEINPLDEAISNFIEENMKLYDIDTVLDEIRKTKIPQSESKKLLDNLKILVKRYVYLDIIKNPPQPKENYFNTVDLLDELNNINTEERPLYDFLRDINLIISKCQDEHFSISSNKIIFEYYTLRKMYWVSPIRYKITANGVYCEVSKGSGEFDKDLISNINAKKDIEIIKINNLNPLDFIQSINKGFNQYKSPQAQFIVNIYNMEKLSLYIYQFEKDDLKDINIIFKDNTELKYSYKIGIVNKKNELFFNYFDEQIKQNSGISKRFIDIVNSFMIENNLLKQSNEVSWDWEMKNDENKYIKCKVDDSKSINVIYQQSFHFPYNNTNDAIDDLIKCFELFTPNNYPIIVIEDYNSGGNTYLSDSLIALINMNKPLIEYASCRFDEEFRDKIAPYLIGERDLDTCKSESLEDFFKKFEIDDYGNNIEGANIKHNRTGLFSGTKTNRTKIELFKKSISKSSKIRKPHEIIIFTDGYSFSATSNFIKTTYLAGGAIIVGYGGNPNFKIFDSSQNPASVIDTKYLYYFDLISKGIEDLFFSIRFTYMEYFDINYEGQPQIPLEFQIHEIDERMEFYEKYSDEYYNNFLDEARKIFDKYKTECNPKNKRLLFITDECKFSDKMIHGGYECGENGKWSKKCVPSYCDEGYIYDKKTNKCIQDICLINDEGYNGLVNEKKREKKAFDCFISSMVFFVVCFILLIIYIIISANDECKIKCEKRNYFWCGIIPALAIGIILILISKFKYCLKL